jgi:predicted phosphate transport protein (TIGR00153 family)
MGIVNELFGRSPFGPIVEHSKKVHECVEMIWPLMEALAEEDFQEIQRIEKKISHLEYEADKIKHAIRQQLTRRYFLPVSKRDLYKFLRRQDKIADYVQDLAVVLTLRKTLLHPNLTEKFFNLLNQIFQVTGILLTAAVELQSLAETSFGGSEARRIMEWLDGLGKEEWKADLIAIELSKDIYCLEKELDPITLIFYEKIVIILGKIANEAENAGDMLRSMIMVTR